jgi:hypothetical protein
MVPEASAYEPGPLARAILRGRAIAEADLRAAGGTFTLDQVIDLLGISRQAIHKRVKTGALIGVPGPDGVLRYPVAQFMAHGTVPGLAEVIAALPTEDPWARLNFMVRPDPHLGGVSPMEALRGGDVVGAVRASTRYGEPGA